MIHYPLQDRKGQGSRQLATVIALVEETIGEELWAKVIAPRTVDSEDALATRIHALAIGRALAGRRCQRGVRRARTYATVQQAQTAQLPASIQRWHGERKSSQPRQRSRAHSPTSPPPTATSPS